MTDEEKYPFGVPCNRPEPKSPWIPNPARGEGWFIDRLGQHKYVEPPKKASISRPPYLIGDWSV